LEKALINSWLHRLVSVNITINAGSGYPDEVISSDFVFMKKETPPMAQEWKSKIEGDIT
jgi:hypothetical protein